ncbi:MAG: DUF1549 and DUF1553 domain-containing protein [Verrucomicrobiales bacterium]
MRSAPNRLAPFSRLLSALALGSAVLWAKAAPLPGAADHWAFQPVREVALPPAGDGLWSKTPVDRFVAARLADAGLAPEPEADPRALIRRMCFDLIGLPPSAEEADRFAAEAARDREAAVARLIDRLLASPRYGERWGRHWLDVARYSDTKGYVYAREERRFVHAPTYRRWVIDAFNRDLPYDRFLLLQIAADQLVAPDSPDLAAMGFVTGGRRFIGVTHDIIDDRIDVVTRGAMALTVQCARCHDHKFDPIPTADYYSLYGVFHGANDRLVTLEEPEDAALAEHRKNLAEAMARDRAAAADRLRARVGDYLAAQLDLAAYPEEGFDQILLESDVIPASVRRWRDYLLTEATADHPIFAPWTVLAALGESGFPGEAAAALEAVRSDSLNPLIASAFSKPVASMADAAARYGEAFAKAEAEPEVPGAAELRAFLRDPESPAAVPDTAIANNELFFPTKVTEALWKLQGEVDRRLIELGAPAALVLEDRAPEPDPHIFTRGQASQLGDAVPRRFLALLSGPDRAPFAHGSGRLELAQRIADPANPLTARVMVNRIWQHHFGAGLVRTASDFGNRADPPSHPDLLDWLASRFVAEGWSIKAMHRLILQSATYRQAPASTHHAADPENRLLCGFPAGRLDFEQIRDAMLAASGELDLAMAGGPRELLDAGNRRRTAYAFVDRQFLPGTFRTFDFANPDIHVAVRHETTVPQQALFPEWLVRRRARPRPRAVRRGGESDPALRVAALYRAVFQREPTAAESAAALDFLQSAKAITPGEAEEPPPSDWQYGTGGFDEAAGRVDGFTPLPHFTGQAWQGAAAYPGGETGWAQLTAAGGHPGNTQAHACIRRWTAPHDAVVSIRGTLTHQREPGDGIRAFISHSRAGQLKAIRLHQSEAAMEAEGIAVRAGDTIDFVVDIGDVLNCDEFLWQPVVESDTRRWDAAKEFGGPMPTPDYLGPWEQFAQVLLLSNEFAFVD